MSEKIIFPEIYASYLTVIEIQIREPFENGLPIALFFLYRYCYYHYYYCRRRRCRCRRWHTVSSRRLLCL